MIPKIHVADTLLSDRYKDLNGVRPINLQTYWTPQELEAEYEYIQNQIVLNDPTVQFNLDIQTMLNNGAADRRTAIRWAKQLNRRA